MREPSLTQSANRSSFAVLVALTLLLGAWWFSRPPQERPGAGNLGREEYLLLEIGADFRLESEFVYDGIVTLLIAGTGTLEDGRMRDAFYIFDPSKTDASPARDLLLIDGDPPEFLPVYRADHIYILRYAVDEHDPTPEARTIRFELEQEEGTGEIEITILPGDVQ